ncbi:hypothetical protein ACWGJ2_08975 [Streptomyces sp. NPDC054796]
MIWEVLGAAALGLALAYAATKRLPARLPNRPLVLATGPGAAVLGGLISRIVLGPGHAPATLAVAVGVSVAILSLLYSENVRPSGLGPRVPSPPRA